MYIELGVECHEGVEHPFYNHIHTYSFCNYIYTYIYIHIHTHKYIEELQNTTNMWCTRLINIFIHARFVTIHIHTYTYIYLICIEGGWNTMGV